MMYQIDKTYTSETPQISLSLNLAGDLVNDFYIYCSIIIIIHHLKKVKSPVKAAPQALYIWWWGFSV